MVYLSFLDPFPEHKNPANSRFQQNTYVSSCHNSYIYVHLVLHVSSVYKIKILSERTNFIWTQPSRKNNIYFKRAH